MKMGKMPMMKGYKMSKPEHPRMMKVGDETMNVHGFNPNDEDDMPHMERDYGKPGHAVDNDEMRKAENRFRHGSYWKVG